MKLTTSLIAAFLAGSAGATGFSEATIKSIAQDKILEEAHARHLAVAEQYKNMAHRNLQDATACDAAFVTLLEDEELAIAIDDYLTAYEQIEYDVTTCDFDDSGTTGNCDFSDAGPDTSALSSACTAQSGSLVAYDSNIKCTDPNICFYFNNPAIQICVPTVEGEDCASEAQAQGETIDQQVKTNLEAVLAASFDSVSCDVGSDVQPCGSAAMSMARGLSAMVGAVAMAFFVM
ncbi:MAG: hypothetical protein SGILL_003952 [Bacillariaceae sp.]